MTQIDENGCCVCGNSLFHQITITRLTPDSTPTTDTSGRKRMHSEDVRKMYECCACKARYLWNEQEGVFKGGE